MSTCQLTKPRTFSGVLSWRTSKRVPGSRISACFDFADHPNEEATYLKHQTNEDRFIQLFQIWLDKFEAWKKNIFRDVRGIIQGQRICVPELITSSRRRATHRQRRATLKRRMSRLFSWVLLKEVDWQSSQALLRRLLDTLHCLPWLSQIVGRSANYLFTHIIYIFTYILVAKAILRSAIERNQRSARLDFLQVAIENGNIGRQNPVWSCLDSFTLVFLIPMCHIAVYISPRRYLLCSLMTSFLSWTLGRYPPFNYVSQSHS